MRLPGRVEVSRVPRKDETGGLEKRVSLGLRKGRQNVPN